MRWVITGANRGIGLEFVRQLLARGEHIVAGAREPSASAKLVEWCKKHPNHLTLASCDVSSDASVSAFVDTLGSEPIDVLVNNAGIYGKMQSLTALDMGDAMNTFQVNTLGPLRVTKALLPRILAGNTKRIVHISSGMGSIADNTSGGVYGYRMSKAALNMANKSMSVDLRDRGVCAVVINPGWVKTDMGGSGAPLEATDSVRQMLEVIDSLTPADSGKFLNYRKGETYPY